MIRKHLITVSCIGRTSCMAQVLFLKSSCMQNMISSDLYFSDPLLMWYQKLRNR